MGPDVLSLLIFGVCVVLFVMDRMPMATVSLLGCTLMVILGVCDFKTAFGQFASSSVVLTVGVMVIGAAISETGLAAAISNWVVKVAKGSETGLIVGTYLVSALMSAFLSNSAVLAIFMPIIMGLSVTDGKIKSRNLIMPIAIACVLGGAATLVGSTQQITAQGLLEEAGVRQFKTFDFTPVGAVTVLVGLLYCLTMGRYLGRRIWGDRAENSEEESGDSAPRNPRKMAIMAVIFAGTVVLYITEWLPVAVTSTLSALCCIITGCISQNKAVFSVNWNIVGRLGGCLGMAKALDAGGGTDLIVNAFNSAVGTSINPFLLFCIVVLAAQLISELTVGTTALIIVLPALIEMAPVMGLNLHAYALGVTLATGCALSTPLASATIGMSMAAGFKFNDYFKHNAPLDLLNYLVLILLIPLAYGLTV